MSEVETVIIVNSKKFYSVTKFVDELKTKENLTGFKQLMIYFDVDEMFDCKTGAIAVKPLLILCGGDNDGKVKAFKHKEIIDLFGNYQPIITYKPTKTKARPDKTNGNVWYLNISLQSQTSNKIVYYPMNVLMSNNERTINAMHANTVKIIVRSDYEKKFLTTEEFEIDL